MKFSIHTYDVTFTLYVYYNSLVLPETTRTVRRHMSSQNTSVSIRTTETGIEVGTVDEVLGEGEGFEVGEGTRNCVVHRGVI